MRVGGPLLDKPDPAARERRIAGLLFFATCASVFGVYLLRWRGVSALDPAAGLRALGFTVALMGILLAHEMGHFAVARLHHFRLSLPWFLPFPFLVGTLGAVIRLRDLPRTRSGLLEMGAAGPLCGLAAIVLVSSAWLLMGASGPAGDLTLSTPLLFWLLSLPLTGAAPPAISASDPLGFAAWLGCLVTAMNLLPFGQLDGGHIVHALIPRRAAALAWVVTALLLVLGLWWPGWAVWAVALHLLGTRHGVDVRRTEAPPTPRARLAAAACAASFLVCFTPVPIRWALSASSP